MTDWRWIEQILTKLFEFKQIKIKTRLSADMKYKLEKGCRMIAPLRGVEVVHLGPFVLNGTSIEMILGWR